ncbi:PDDEXK family nuclease, partial [Burkholderia cenocepacia]
MLEKTVETYLVDRVRAAGGDAYKFSSPARVSVPDRIVVFPPARIYFVELKRPGGKLTRGQEREHARLRALGCDVRTLDSREAVDAFVREAGAAAAPADERAAFDVRSFEEWLDQQRDADVASV